MKFYERIDAIFFKKPVAAYIILVFALIGGFTALQSEVDQRVKATETLTAQNFRLAQENSRLVAENKRQDQGQCEGINGVNAAVRFLLDGSIRNRPAGSPSFTDDQRAFARQVYERLPETDCATNAKKTYDPPFPETDPNE